MKMITANYCGIDVPIPDKNVTVTYFSRTCMEMLSEFFKKIYNTPTDAEATVFSIICALITIFGALGNGLVIFVILRKRAMQTSRNVYILNLALSNFLLSILLYPFLWIPDRDRSFKYGSNACKLVTAFPGSNVYCSTLTIAMMSIDRYYAARVQSSFRHEKNETKISIVISILIWIVAISLSTPLLIFYDTIEYPPHWIDLPLAEGGVGSFTWSMCQLAPHADQSELMRISMFINLSQSTFLYIVPMVVITVFNIKLSRYVSSNMMSSTAAAGPSSFRTSRVSSMTAGGGHSVALPTTTSTPTPIVSFPDDDDSNDFNINPVHNNSNHNQQQFILNKTTRPMARSSVMYRKHSNNNSGGDGGEDNDRVNGDQLNSNNNTNDCKKMPAPVDHQNHSVQNCLGLKSQRSLSDGKVTHLHRQLDKVLDFSFVPPNSNVDETSQLVHSSTSNKNSRQASVQEYNQTPTSMSIVESSDQQTMTKQPIFSSSSHNRKNNKNDAGYGRRSCSRKSSFKSSLFKTNTFLSARFLKSVDKRRQRMLLLLTLMGGSYALLWLPYTLLTALLDFQMISAKYINTNRWIDYSCKAVSMVSICVNPFLYGYLNTNFQREFKRIFNQITLKLCKREYLRSSTFNTSTSTYRSRCSTTNNSLYNNSLACNNNNDDRASSSWSRKLSRSPIENQLINSNNVQELDQHVGVRRVMSVGNSDSTLTPPVNNNQNNRHLYARRESSLGDLKNHNLDVIL